MRQTAPTPPRWLLVALAGVALMALDYGLARALPSAYNPPLPVGLFVVGELAFRLGDGLTLAVLCLSIWFVGWLGPVERWRIGGRWALWALGLAGLWAQMIKQLVGRPRPSLFLKDGLWLPHSLNPTPSFDSFPSGHAFTSFAVATVLAAVFPGGRLAIWLAAGFIAVGRVLGLRHFGTDVLIGAALGLVVGGYCLERYRAELGDDPA